MYPVRLLSVEHFVGESSFNNNEIGRQKGIDDGESKIWPAMRLI